MKLNIIAAMANNRVIGLNNKMPWHLPADLSWFKKNTLNKPIIMGRKTFDSIGMILPKRLNIVISRTKQESDNPNLILCRDLDHAIEIAKHQVQEDAFIIGGGTIYEQVLPQVDKLYLTHIKADFNGDTQFPIYEQFQWQCIFKEDHQADSKNSYDYQFRILEKVK